MKSAKQKAKKAAPKKSAPKKKAAVAPPEDFYRIDIEQAGPNNTHVLRTHVSFTCVDETTAREGMAACQMIGVGGRMVKLDGTPDGQLVEKWGSIGDVEQALATEAPETPSQTD